MQLLRQLGTALLASVVLAGCATQQVNDQHTSWKQRVLDPTVSLMVYINGKPAVSGSGVAIARESGWTYILTARHNVLDANLEDAESVSLQVQRGPEKSSALSTQLVDTSLVHDLMLLKVRKQLPVAQLADSSPRYTQPVQVIGNALNRGLSVTEGIVSKPEAHLKDQRFFVVSAPVTNGVSGGGVFTHDRTLLGIAIAMHRIPVQNANGDVIRTRSIPHVGYAVPLPAIRTFLSNAPAPISVQK
jgi:S1-C subfamily serine protease